MADIEEGKAVVSPDGPPPNYDSVAGILKVINTQQKKEKGIVQDVDIKEFVSTKDPPPSYESIFGEIRQARDESSGTVDFLKKLGILALSTIGCTFCLAIFLAIPIASIILGVKYKDDCPYEHYIPIYLIVLGAFGVLRNLIGLCTQIKKHVNSDDSNNGENNENDKKKSSCESIIDCFIFGWFIAGNVWIYRIYSTVTYDDPLLGTYCHETLYLFAFWLTTASYIFVGVVFCCMCCVACCAALAD